MEYEVLRSFDGFEQNLYQQCAVGHSQNVIVSSFSVMMALTMAMMGSRGRTEETMRNALGYKNVQSNEILTSVKNISHLMQSDDTVKVANKLYLASQYDLNPEYKTNVVNYFDSEIEKMDYSDPDEAAKSINNWIEVKTNHKIKDVIQSDYLRRNPPLILVNAVHFKAKWLNPFNKDLTKPMDFWVSNEMTKKTDFMRHTKNHRFGYNTQLDSDVLMMNYKDSDMSMVIVLPKERNGLSIVEHKLQNILLNDILRTIFYQEVAVTMPKFKIEYQIELKDPLTKMGLGPIFESGANFGGMLSGAGNLKVEKVIHKAFIDVNEEHTEAAAVTVVGIATYSARISPPPKIFTADHPFVFYLYNRRLQTVVFSGKYVSP